MNKIREQLKDRWLDYWEKNRSWIIPSCQYNGYRKTPDNGRRPRSNFIIVVLTVLSNQFALTWLEILYSLNSNEDDIIRALGLDFDPDIELKKREEERENLQQQAHLLPDEDEQKQLPESSEEE